MNTIVELDQSILACKPSHVFNFAGEVSGFTSQSLSHNILHVIPLDSKFKITAFEFGSNYIAEKIINKFYEKQREKVINNMNVTIFRHSRLGGKVFEQLAHIELSEANSFQIRPLLPQQSDLVVEIIIDNNSMLTSKIAQNGSFQFNNLPLNQEYTVLLPSHNMTTNIQSTPTSSSSRKFQLTGNIRLFSSIFHSIKMDRRYFDSITNLDNAIYWIPQSKNYNAIDSLIKYQNISHFFQTTVSETHPTNRDNFHQLITEGSFQHIFLYFVVPEDRYNSFSYENTYQHENVSQFCLLLK
ncbi:hypothetical protein DLAC_09721 [Tieghemostelium lacteum]|uniref:Uncharacterized protein n=1 Tax=Tieghemostelium lacteum TaxID=361077 RepID=A0A151Z714_TIELA|nr:hypothetical protein DLAC_09721 [Tieghemostelium lacteum]|eukprot:KYQ89752.1 hypothetical protein DLAC_09721 [Tieghemostelium lacteum]